VLLVSPRGPPAPGDYGAWLDAGPGVACKLLALEVDDFLDRARAEAAQAQAAWERQQGLLGL
jgi:hypothetical protein